MLRLNSMLYVAEKPADIYVLMDAASAYIFGHIIAMGEEPAMEEVERALIGAWQLNEGWPTKILWATGDPIGGVLPQVAQKHGIACADYPSSYFTMIARPVQASFDEKFGFPSINRHPRQRELKAEIAAFIPDAYAPCNCGSGKKYKFCCKPIFHEITEAMVASEDGDIDQALEWIEKAKAKVGETAEIYCRLATICYEDEKKFNDYLDKCPQHPRASYLRGLRCKEDGKFDESVSFYRKAIDLYPPTAKFHLNEVWNNLGTAYYELKEFKKAKEAWEQAAIYLPSDEVTRDNLFEFIYENEEIPSELRRPSPNVMKILTRY